MEGSIDPNFLSEDEVNYELDIRGTTTTRSTLNSKRVILSRLLEIELKENRDIAKLKPSTFNGDDEKAFIDDALRVLNDLIKDFSGTVEDTVYKTIHSRLVSLMNRIRRFKIPKEPEESRNRCMEFKNESFAKSIELDAILCSKVKVNTVSKIENNLTNMSLSSSNLPSTSKSVPVFKWNLFFDGKNMPLLSFLNLFKGDIKIWYN